MKHVYALQCSEYGPDLRHVLLFSTMTAAQAALRRKHNELVQRGAVVMKQDASHVQFFVSGWDSYSVTYQIERYVLEDGEETKQCTT